MTLCDRPEKISERERARIRKLYWDGVFSVRGIASQYQVSMNDIWERLWEKKRHYWNKARMGVIYSQTS